MTEDEFAEALELVPPDPAPLIYLPSGVYLCGCPWVGNVVPHFCPVHPGACIVFKIRERES